MITQYAFIRLSLYESRNYAMFIICEELEFHVKGKVIAGRSVDDMQIRIFEKVILILSNWCRIEFCDISPKLSNRIEKGARNRRFTIFRISLDQTKKVSHSNFDPNSVRLTCKCNRFLHNSCHGVKFNGLRPLHMCIEIKSSSSFKLSLFAQTWSMIVTLC